MPNTADIVEKRAGNLRPGAATQRGERQDAGPAARQGGEPAQRQQTARTREPVIRSGRVWAYSVASDGLRIKLEGGAINRSLIFVGADEPHFRPAVSAVMLAYNSRYAPSTGADGKPTIDNQFITARIESAPQPNGFEAATAIALGKDPFEFKDWVIRAEDVVRSS